MKRLFSLLIILLLAFSAISFAQNTDNSEDHNSDSTMSDSMDSDSDENSDGMMDSDGMEDSTAVSTMSEEEMAELAASRPDWHNLELVSAITGETFTLTSLHGKTIFVEPMATWCSNCTRQLGAVDTAKAQLMAEELGEDFVFLALSIEGNLANEKLANHAERMGSTIDFAVASQDLIRGISEAHGRGALNPPSTPHFIIKSNGEMTEVKTGMESSQEIYDELIAAHASGMVMMEETN